MTPYISKHTKKGGAGRGFSLIETIIVMGLIGIFAGIGLQVGIDTFERGLARTDRLLALSALREARAESMNNVCMNTNCSAPVPHGVYFEENKITIFEGASYSERYTHADITIPFSSPQTICNTSVVIFAPGTGDTASTTLSLIGKDNREITISLNSQGGISSNS